MANGNERLEQDIGRVIGKVEQEGEEQGAPILDIPLLDYEPAMPAQSLIDGLAETRDRIALAASAGEGKTTKIQCLAAQAAKGIPVWGRFAVPRPLKVALIEEELTGERPKQIVEHLEETIGTIPRESLRLYRAQRLYEGKLVEGAFTITEQAEIDKLSKALIAYHPDIIILDGWFKFVANQENEDTIVDAAIGWMDFIVNATGATMIVVCHTRKHVPMNLGAGRFDSISGKGLHRWAKARLILRRIEGEWNLFSKLYGSSSNPEWGDLLYILYWNPETWITSVAGKEDTPSELWRVIYPEDSKAECRDLVLRARAVGLTDKDIAAVTGVSDRMVRYWRAGHSAMTGDKKHILMNKVKQLEKQRGW